MTKWKIANTGLAAVATVYLIGLLQGLVLVSFPASSAVLKQMHGFSDAQYGAIFLPQVALTVFGAVMGGVLAQRLGLKRLLWLAAMGSSLSQLVLAGSAWVWPEMAFPLILVATACMGLGFGLAGAPLNGYPPIFFPRHPHTAVVALHTLLGLGLAVGPVLAGRFVHVGVWVGFPLALLCLSVLLAATAFSVRLPENTLEQPQSIPAKQELPLRSASFWGLAAVAMTYAFAEGTFSNWAVIYLYEAKRLPEMVAALSLSVFWAAMVAGRLIVSALVVWITPQAIWMTLPVLMATTFLLLPFADTALLGLGLFGLAGLACSAFFPLTITLASERFPGHVAWVSSMMIAALMVGVGLGSFIIGPLRDWLPFERLYQLSALYPALVLGMAAWLMAAGKPSRVPVA